MVILGIHARLCLHRIAAQQRNGSADHIGSGLTHQDTLIGKESDADQGCGNVHFII